MNKSTAAVAFCITILIHSCQPWSVEPKGNAKKSFRDTILKNYVLYTDSLIKYDNETFYLDSADYNYRLLKSYYNNDSVALSEYARDTNVNRETRWADIAEKKAPVLKTMSVDEAYQFNYDQSFCQYMYNLTAGKKGDSIGLHIMIYEIDRLTEKVSMIKEYDKRLTPANWSDLAAALYFADFWQLKQFGSVGCCDGDFLTIHAIVRRPADAAILRSYSIRRQFVSGTAIFKAYDLLFGLSGIKEKCN